MKFFAVFAAVLAISAAAPTTSWTLNDLSNAIQSPATPAAVLPYLEAALNQMMEALFSGHAVDSISVPTPAGLLPVEAISPSPAVVMPAEVDLTPAGPTTSWTLNDLSQAIQSPATPAALLPYLEAALNQMMDAIFAGHPVDSIAVPTPAGLLPIEAISPSPAVVMPAEVDLTPVSPAPVPAPVVPAPAAVADAASPLVQIIVNIKSQESEAAVPAPVPAPVVVPEAVYEPQPLPVIVVEQPSPVVVAPSPIVVPEPIEIGPAPAPVVVPEPIVIAPEPIVIAPEVPAPIVIAPEPIVIPEPVEVNPIDIIAVGAPDVNPIDLLQPIPVAVAGETGHAPM